MFHQSKKKILITINNHNLGGIEKFSVLLAQYLDSEKYDIVIGMPMYGKLCEIFDKHNIKYFSYNNGRKGKVTIKGFAYLFGNVMKNRYDIIHAQAGIAPCLVGKILGTKLLIEHKHGLDNSYEVLSRMSFSKLFYERLKKYLVDITIAVCNTDKEYLINKFRYKSEKIKVVFNGIENSELQTRKKRNKFIIGSAGRLSFPKAHENFIEMAKKLTESGYDFEYHIYGDGEMRNKLEELIKNYNLGNRFFLCGFTEDISTAFNEIDLFILTSRYEGIPYVIIEAMRSSLPIIATNVGGIPEVIENMKNGIIVVKENIEELTQSVIKLFNDYELRQRIASEARKDFENKYRIEKTIKQIEKIYERK